VEEGGGSGCNFLNGLSQKPAFLPRYAQGARPPFRGNLPHEPISRQSSFSRRGAQSTAAKSRALQTACCRRVVRPAGQEGASPGTAHRAAPAASRSSPPQPPNRGTAPRYPACGAGTRRAGLAWHGTAIPSARSWHPACEAGTVQHQGAWYQCGTGTAPGSTVCRLAWHRAASGAALLTPLPPTPAQGRS